MNNLLKEKVENMACPFCSVDMEFDLVGLKDHLLNACTVFPEVESAGGLNE